MLGQYRGVQHNVRHSDFVRRWWSTLREKGGRQTKGKGSSRVQFWGGGLTQKHATVVRGLARRVSVGQPRGRGKVSAQSTPQNIRTRSLGTGIALSCTSGSAETQNLLPLGSYQDGHTLRDYRGSRERRRVVRHVWRSKERLRCSVTRRDPSRKEHSQVNVGAVCTGIARRTGYRVEVNAGIAVLIRPQGLRRAFQTVSSWHEGPQGESNPHRFGGTARGRRAGGTRTVVKIHALIVRRKRLHAGHSAVTTRSSVVPGVNRLGVVARAREETSLSGSGSTYRGKRTVASVPTGDLAQRKEKPHVRGSRAAETVAQDARRRKNSLVTPRRKELPACRSAVMPRNFVSPLLTVFCLVSFRPDDCSTCEEGTLMEKRLGGLHGHLTKGLVPGLLYRRRTGVMFVS
ncbi:hypothetical protein TNCT_644811 [Trichonephila clavata]|uniref:Uncharacterized protein n=1 Tax=Trichonephila clavata TaxID=2740835 RepID=A0A8X6L3N7_TRICU|nr:hypothetical protein TNCT_644811 [Trichonephila clavata]